MCDAKALRIGIEKNDEQAIRTAVSNGANANAFLDNGRSKPLERAVSAKTRILELLLELGADVNGVSLPNKVTALHVAAMIGRVDAVRCLIAHGADVNCLDGMKSSPLMYAVSHEGENFMIVAKDLIKAGANVNHGVASSVLMVACRTGSDAVVRELLDAGADVNQLLANGTALHSAIEAKHFSIVQQLLERGCNATVRTTDRSAFPGCTALELAMKMKQKQIITVLANSVEGTAMANPPVLEISWETFVFQLKESQPKTYRSLNKGASVKSIAAIETAIGAPLPGAFSEYLTSNNGQKAGAKPMIRPEEYLDSGMSLLSAEDILMNWKMMANLVTAGEFQSLSVTCDSEIQQTWWSISWVPFASDGRGDFLCIDLAPAGTGTIGQVISFRHDGPRRRCLASSFSEWIADVLENLVDY